MSTRLPIDKSLSEDSYSLKGLIRIFSRPENDNSDAYWIDAGFIENLPPEGF